MRLGNSVQWCTTHFMSQSHGKTGNERGLTWPFTGLMRSLTGLRWPLTRVKAAICWVKETINWERGLLDYVSPTMYVRVWSHCGVSTLRIHVIHYVSPTITMYVHVHVWSHCGVSILHVRTCNPLRITNNYNVRMKPLWCKYLHVCTHM